jgi:hypothetical protein
MPATCCAQSACAKISNSDPFDSTQELMQDETLDDWYAIGLVTIATLLMLLLLLLLPSSILIRVRITSEYRILPRDVRFYKIVEKEGIIISYPLGKKPSNPAQGVSKARCQEK